MKNGGFTLIELIIAVALVGILSSLVTPKVRIQLAKGRDTKAISYLGAMRTAAELYYIESGEAPTAVVEPDEEEDKKAIKNILPYLDPKAEAVIKDGKIQIGGSRKDKDKNTKITFGGEMRFTFKSPQHDEMAKRGDGVYIWFAPTEDQVYDIQGNKWIEY